MSQLIHLSVALALTASAAAPAGPALMESPSPSAVRASVSPCDGGTGTSTAWYADASDDQIVLVGDAQTSASACRSSARTYAERRVPRRVCGAEDTGASRTTCIDAASVDVSRLCLDGSRARNPLERRQLDEDGHEFGPWVQVDDGCPADPQAAVILTVEDFRRLPLVPSVPSFQPANGRGLVNMELIVFTDPAPQVLQTTVLGTPVTVRATPTQFWWEFGDGSEPLVTTDPGAPYPEFRVFHVYEQAGSFQVQLTTMWSGQFQVNGQGPWFAVTGTAQTVSPAFAETVVEARSHLVDEPLP